MWKYRCGPRWYLQPRSGHSGTSSFPDGGWILGINKHRGSSLVVTTTLQKKPVQRRYYRVFDRDGKEVGWDEVQVYEVSRP